METPVILFTLLSVVLHVSWNLISKKNNPSLAFFICAIGSSTFLLSPLLLLDDRLLQMPWSFWQLVICTGFFQTIYMLGLAWGYSKGEMSLVYPVARALPVIFVPMISVFAFNKDFISLIDWLAFGVIFLGALLLPLGNSQHLSLKVYTNPSLRFALLAAAGTVGYSLMDGAAIKQMLTAGYGHLSASLSYMLVQAYATIAWSIPLIFLLPGERNSLGEVLRHYQKAFWLTGIMIMATYALVLLAISYARDVSYVVAIRQLSILISVLLGVYILQESRSALKLIGTLMIFTGLATVTLNKG